MECIENECAEKGLLWLGFKSNKERLEDFVDITPAGQQFLKIFIKSLQFSQKYYVQVYRSNQKKNYIKPQAKNAVGLEDLRQLTKYYDFAKIYRNKDDKKPLLLLNFDKPSITTMSISEENHRKNLKEFINFRESRKSRRSKRTI